MLWTKGDYIEVRWDPSGMAGQFGMKLSYEVFKPIWGVSLNNFEFTGPEEVYVGHHTTSNLLIRGCHASVV